MLLLLLLLDGGVDPELESGVCNELGVDEPPPPPPPPPLPAPVGVPAIESGSSLMMATCDSGDGVAAADG